MRKKILGTLFSFITLIALWELLCFFYKGAFVPHFLKILQSLCKILLDYKTWLSILHTLYVIFIGIIVSLSFSVVLASAEVSLRLVELLVEPVINFIRHIPTIALYPVFLALFGVSDKARIALISLNSFPAIMLSMSFALKYVDKSVVEAGKCAGASSLQILVFLRFPIALKEILNGIRIAVGSSFVAVVVAEMLGATNGLGFMILWATNAFDYSSVYAYIIILSVIGMIVNTLFSHLINKIGDSI